MELPKEYENWIEFAKKCIDVQSEYPDTLHVTIDNSDYNNKIHNTKGYVINDVKAKAFDEILKGINFTKEDVIYLKNNAVDSEYNNKCYVSILSMVETLISLTK